MFTVQDYQLANPKGLLYINKCLKDVEAILTDLGYNWFDAPLTVWPEVYQRIGLLSDNLVQRYSIAIKAFYRWAEENGALPYSQVSYSNFTPKLGENIKAGLQGRYIKSLDELLTFAFESEKNYLRKSIDTLRADNLILCMLWMQMSVEEIISVRVDDVQFYAADNKVLAKKQFALKDVHHVIINCLNERSVLASHGDILMLLYHVYMRASNLLFTTEKGTPCTVNGFNKRISRITAQINDECGINISAKSIRGSGLYYRIYRNWEEAKMPYVYTDNTIDYLFNLLGNPLKASTAVKQAEFARFLEYAREIQGKNV